MNSKFLNFQQVSDHSLLYSMISLSVCFRFTLFILFVCYFYFNLTIFNCLWSSFFLYVNTVFSQRSFDKSSNKTVIKSWSMLFPPLRSNRNMERTQMRMESKGQNNVIRLCSDHLFKYTFLFFFCFVITNSKMKRAKMNRFTFHLLEIWWNQKTKSRWKWSKDRMNFSN